MPGEPRPAPPARLPGIMQPHKRSPTPQNSSATTRHTRLIPVRPTNRQRFLLRERAHVCGRCPGVAPHCASQTATYRRKTTAVASSNNDEPAFPDDHAGDVELVRLALAGEASAVDQLTSRMRCIGRILAARNRRHGYVLRAEDMEDLQSEVMTSILSRLPQFRGIGPLEAWTHSFCDHAFRNAARRRIRERRSMAPLDDAELLADRRQEPSTLDDPLFHCLQRLPPRDQWILHRKYHEDATLEEIARAIGCNLNTLKSQYTRTLEQLRQCLGAAGCK